jgi:flavin-dependent dehydrogenase
MLDVIIAGAGPAGSVAALVLARAGARVVIVDREVFPRDKLCGDTLNPGALGLLASLGLTGGPLAAARPLAGMLISGPHVSVRARYGGDVAGRALTRRDLDAWLLEQAIHAGARFEGGLMVRGPLADVRAGRTFVRGLLLERRADRGSVLRMPATMTIAADGRRSVLARALALSAHPRRPRRWAFGVYAANIRGLSDLGEMHIRPGYYLGIAPLSDTLANVCVVTGAKPDGPTPLAVISRAIGRDAGLSARFEGAAFVSRVRVLGPLAVDGRAAGTDGLLLAGDAAGFVDPMTGDGLCLAMRGAVLAAHETLRVFEAGEFSGAPARLAEARRDALGRKLRFNRILRRLVASPVGIELAGWGAALAPAAIRRVVRYAGDAA